MTPEALAALTEEQTKYLRSCPEGSDPQFVAITEAVNASVMATIPLIAAVYDAQTLGPGMTPENTKALAELDAATKLWVKAEWNWSCWNTSRPELVQKE